MARVLFAWELGANLGHLARDLPVAEHLRAMGHEVAFAVRDTATAAQLLFPRGFGFVQAPLGLRAENLRRSPANYAEILLAEGYGRRDALLGRMRAWRLLFDLCRPDVLVADHAPTALASAWQVSLPAVPFGTGFAIPPAVSPLPSIRPWEEIDGERLVRAEHKVLETLGFVTGALGGRAPERLSDLFATPVLATFPELDHYGPRAAGFYVGSVHAVESGARAEWPDRAGPRVLAYLRSTVPGFAAALRALSDLGGNVITVAPGMSPADTAQFESPGHVIFSHHLRLDALLAQADLVVSYGGAGMVTQSLLAGVPLLLLPQTVEQWLGAQRVVALGAGCMVGKGREVDDIRSALAVSMEDGLRRAAQDFARRHGKDDPTGAAQRVCNVVLQAITGGSV